MSARVTRVKQLPILRFEILQVANCRERQIFSPACCMLIVGLCIGLSAVCALLVTAAASQLRQRNVAAPEVEVGHR